MSLPSGTRFGPYVLAGRIGVGGMGEVYRAEDVRLGRDVAIKVLPGGFGEDRERQKRFEQEARILAALSHPNILAVYDVGTQEGSPYLVMELLEGETLRERLARGALPVQPAVELALQMARGLAAAHAKGLIHRDLKPGNLFITHEGHLKILDFGLAKQAVIPPGDWGRRPAEEAEALTLDGLAMGTVGYMSPEQVMGQPVDARSDLFALGVVLYEMVSGRRAFERTGAFESMEATLKEEPPELQAPAGPVSWALRRLVARCLEKDPARRFESAQHLARALQALLEAGVSGGGMGHPRLGGRNRRRAARRFGPLAAAILAALGFATALAWHPWRKGPVRPPSVVALPARVLGSPESAFLADAVPDTLSTLLAGVEGIEAKCPPSSIELEKVGGDTAKVAQAYGVDLLLVTTVTVQGDRLFLNAQLVEAFTHKVRWASQLEGTRGDYNNLVRQAAVGIARALRPPGAPSSVLPGPAFRSEIELALREGRYLERRYSATWKESDFELALAALQRAQSMDPTSATLAAELGALFGAKEVRALDPLSHQQAKAWADRALELDPQCGLAWTVLCWHEANKPGKADPDKLAEYALKAVALNPGDIRGHVSLGAVAPTMGMCQVIGLNLMEMDPLDYAGYELTAYALMDTGRAEEAALLLEKALRLQLPERRANNWGLSRALYMLGRNEEALKVYTPGWGWDGGLLGSLLSGDPAAARQRGLEVVARWRTKEANAWYWANRAYFVAPLLVRVGLREEALWLLQKAAETRGPMNLDRALLDPDLRQLRGDPRYHQAVAAYRENALRFLKHAEAAEAQGNLPGYLRPSVAELRDLVERPL